MLKIILFVSKTLIYIFYLSDVLFFENTNLAALGALAHRLQSRTACNT